MTDLTVRGLALALMPSLRGFATSGVVMVLWLVIGSAALAAASPRGQNPGAAQRRTDPSSEVIDVSGRPVQARGGQEQELQRTAGLALIEQRMQAVYEQVAPAIVRFAYGKDPELPLGSGVIITADGHVVTSGPVHAVVEDDLLALRLADGRRVRGKALGWSSEFKIGLMKIAEEGPWPHVDLGNRADIEAGQLCVGLGYPGVPGVEFDRRPALSAGSVTKSAASTWLTSSCRFRPCAYSVFDLDGRLLGLTFETDHMGDDLHTSIETLRTHWDDLVAGKNLDRVRLLSSETEVGESPAVPPSKSQPAGQKERVAAAIEKATRASVRISEEGQSKGFASGAVVTADGYLITCGHHERLPGQRLTVSLPDGRDASAVVLGTNPVCDIGLMKITDEGPWPHVEMGHSTIMRPGDRCVLIGFPRAWPGRQPWVRQTQIIQPTRTNPRKDEWYCEFWTSGYPEDLGGASGGGVFDLQGRVVGVLLGGAPGEGEKGEMQHARVELFRKQWDLLAAARPVDVLDSDPLAEITAAFGRIAEDLPPIAVEVLGDGKPRALGTIVGGDGRILTKASELVGAVSCRLADGRVFPASVQEVSREHDLALLKIDAAGLPEARWSRDESIAPGTLIAALVPGEAPRAGVVSLAARPRPPVTGALGVILGDGDFGLEVYDLVDRGYDVPLRKGDVVVHVEGRPTPDLDAYRALMEPESGAAIAYAGDPVRVGVRRGRDTLEFRFALLPFDFFRSNARTASRRWWGFPSVFDTDVQLAPTQCGGPMIDRSGRVAGIAIACHLSFGNLGQRHVIPAAVARQVFAD